MNTGNGKTFYTTLQVSQDASQEVIRAAYKTLSTKYHPDKDSSKEAAEKFAAVQEAFETLSDVERRARYDADTSEGPCTASSFGDVVMRVDGTSSHLTLEEHLKRGGKELAECDLSGRNLNGVSFRHANLTKAKLDGSSFVGCDFRQVNLTDLSAKDCKFTGAFFGGAQIIRTDFSGSLMRGAAFFGAMAVWRSRDKSDSRFSNFDNTASIVDRSVETGVTKIELATFRRCDLTESQFAATTAKEVCISNTVTVLGLVKRQVPAYLKQKFCPCSIIDSNFSKANMSKCNLQKISLKGSIFEETVLNGANLKGANIEGVHFADCSVTNLDLHEATYSDDTLLPNGFRIPSNAKKSIPQQRPQLAVSPPAAVESDISWGVWVICFVIGPLGLLVGLAILLAITLG